MCIGIGLRLVRARLPWQRRRRRQYSAEHASRAVAELRRAAGRARARGCVRGGIRLADLSAAKPHRRAEGRWLVHARPPARWYNVVRQRRDLTTHAHIPPHTRAIHRLALGVVACQATPQSTRSALRAARADSGGGGAIGKCGVLRQIPLSVHWVRVRLPWQRQHRAGLTRSASCDEGFACLGSAARTHALHSTWRPSVRVGATNASLPWPHRRRFHHHHKSNTHEYSRAAHAHAGLPVSPSFPLSIPRAR